MKSIAFLISKEHSGWWPGIWFITPCQGLSYYTGCIPLKLKIGYRKAPEIKMGPIGEVADTTISQDPLAYRVFQVLGFLLAERILRCAGRTQCFPQGCRWSVKLIFLCFDAEALVYAFDSLLSYDLAASAVMFIPIPKPWTNKMNYAN